MGMLEDLSWSSKLRNLTEHTLKAGLCKRRLGDSRAGIIVFIPGDRSLSMRRSNRHWRRTHDEGALDRWSQGSLSMDLGLSAWGSILIAVIVVIVVLSVIVFIGVTVAVVVVVSILIVVLALILALVLVLILVVDRASVDMFHVVKLLLAGAELLMSVLRRGEGGPQEEDAEVHLQSNFSTVLTGDYLLLLVVLACLDDGRWSLVVVIVVG